jgi:hypothetical protein
MSNYLIRPIEPRDDAAVAAIIRAVMPEFGAVGDGFAINDLKSTGCIVPTRRPAARTSWSKAMAWWSVVAAWRRCPAAMAIPASCARCISCRRRAAWAPAPR